MSRITNIIITGCFYETGDKEVIQILDYFNKVSKGGLSMNCLDVVNTVISGSFKDFESGLFLRVISALKSTLTKHEFDTLQILVMNEDDEIWTMYEAGDLKVGSFYTSFQR